MAFSKLSSKYPSEMDASLLLKVLKNRWKGGPEYGGSSPTCPLVRSQSCCSMPVLMAEKPSLELCKSLIMLRDYNISGKINLIDVPALMHTLHFWRVRMCRPLSPLDLHAKRHTDHLTFIQRILDIPWVTHRRGCQRLVTP